MRERTTRSPSRRGGSGSIWLRPATRETCSPANRSTSRAGAAKPIRRSILRRRARWVGLRCATVRDCRLARVLIREVMTESVVTAEPQRTVREIAELMRERNVGSVVLVEDDKPVGFVTDRDLTLSVIADGRDLSDHIADHASSPVVTADPAMSVDECADLMVRHGVRRLVVVDGDRLTGIVTLDDLVSRTGDAELASQLSTRVTRAVMPDFFFRERGS
jgi:CBS domain-containing protein